MTVKLQRSCYSPDIFEIVTITNVAGTGESGHYCQFVHALNICTETLHTYNCSCDPNNGTYTVNFTEAGDGSTDEWLVVGKLASSGREIKERVTLRRKGIIIALICHCCWAAVVVVVVVIATSMALKGVRLECLRHKDAPPPPPTLPPHTSPPPPLLPISHSTFPG